ncbi:hypothetical protein ACRE_064850 [Hapsidospora chrysogenum ATCC 11550]|uniref:Uncharacterized protein n=1 Tax=Hapsidospora chrysogenum (strain ATCC 11550 / CBS 779.69 / DSM 880 / IAM 14645 / JCM 23072 / IMI 49137) TaxID=857340 RepID=A0A086T081_HAPC1|nr:hypothetical protein ACRE_064850 [Hapsidospora chrysogenum ATCC 11550]
MAEGVAAVVYSTDLSLQKKRRNKLRRHSIRKWLRVTTLLDGGADDVPIGRPVRVRRDKRQDESPISDDESDDSGEEDGAGQDSDDEGDSGEARPTRPVGRPPGGGFFTIIRTLSSTEVAGAPGFSTIERPRPRPTDDGATESESVVNSRPNPSTLASSTTRNPNPPPRPTAPSEENGDVDPAPGPTDIRTRTTAEGPAAGRPTSNIPAGDTDASSSSSILPTDAAEPSVSMIPGDAEGLESNESAGPRLSRGADVGIILGTLGEFVNHSFSRDRRPPWADIGARKALTTLLIAIGFFFYRRRLNAKNRDAEFPPPPPLARLSEKPLPPAPSQAQDIFNPPPPPGGAPRDLRFNSWANYQPPLGENGGQGEPIPAGYYGRADEEQGVRRGITVPGFIPAQPPLKPQPPPMAYMADERETPSREMMRTPQTAGALAPPGQRPLHRGGSYSIYPPGHVTSGNYRPPSVSRTEATDSTEGTWRTWNVDQRQASRGR